MQDHPDKLPGGAEGWGRHVAGRALPLALGVPHPSALRTTRAGYSGVSRGQPQSCRGSRGFELLCSHCHISLGLMGCRRLSVCPCETTVRAPGTAPWELVLLTQPGMRCWPCRGHVQTWSLLAGSLSLGLLGCRGPFCVPLLTPPFQEEQHGRSPPPGSAGLDLQMGTPSSHMRGGTVRCTRQLWRQELGKVWTPIIHGWPRLPICPVVSSFPPRAPLFPRAPLVLLLARGLRDAARGAQHPQGQCNDNTVLLFFGEVSGVSAMPGSTPSPTACCTGGL